MLILVLERLFSALLGRKSVNACDHSNPRGRTAKLLLAVYRSQSRQKVAANFGDCSPGRLSTCGMAPHPRVRKHRLLGTVQASWRISSNRILSRRKSHGRDAIHSQSVHSTLRPLASHDRQSRHNIAIIHGERRLTYREPHALMYGVGKGLQRDGIEPQQAIAACAQSSIEYAAVFMGSLRAWLGRPPPRPRAWPP